MKNSIRTASRLQSDKTHDPRSTARRPFFSSQSSGIAASNPSQAAALRHAALRESGPQKKKDTHTKDEATKIQRGKEEGKKAPGSQAHPPPKGLTAQTCTYSPQLTQTAGLAPVTPKRTSHCSRALSGSRSCHLRNDSGPPSKQGTTCEAASASPILVATPVCLLPLRRAATNGGPWIRLAVLRVDKTLASPLLPLAPRRPHRFHRCRRPHRLILCPFPVPPITLSPVDRARTHTHTHTALVHTLTASFIPRRQ